MLGYLEHIRLKICIGILFLLITSVSFTQTEIKGKVVDADSEKPLEFVSVLLRGIVDDSPFSGGNTEADGTFSVSTDSSLFNIEVRFMGFNSVFFDSLIANVSSIDLGTIKLDLIDKSLDEVTVIAEKSTTQFRLDKRVFNVGKDISTSGASALEVLNHVPSVTVSMEGLVALRGSQGVQILINGKPSVMSDDPSKVLGTITADMIDRIEVITNPSAKYESEGTSGIINVILKKDEKEGLNGSISLNTGIPDNYSIGISLNRRTEKFNLFTQMGAGYRSLPRYLSAMNRDKTTGEEVQSEGINYRNEQFYNITLGTDYHIDERNVITLSGNFAYEIEQQPSETQFEQSLNGGAPHSVWTRKEETSARNPKYQYDLQYKREFKDTSEHTLSFSSQGRFFGKTQSSEFDNRSAIGLLDFQKQRTRTTFKQADYTFKFDYTKPFAKYFILETGSQYTMNDVGNDYAVEDSIIGFWEVDSSLTNDFRWKQNVLGVYTTGSFEKNKWGIKLGLRAENTLLNTELVTTGQRDDQNYTNLFPTFHTAYKFSKNISMQLGYSRRIRRPRLWDLNPFFNISNNFNIRRGNPELLPEFTDSYELTSIYLWSKVSMNFGVYYRYTTRTIERVSLFENNVNTVMPLNIGTNATTGVEFNAKYSPTKWLTANGDFNLNYFNRKGQFESQNFDFIGNKYQSKLMLKFKVTKAIDLELTGNHESGYLTIQGMRDPIAYMDAGFRLKLLKGKGIINVGVRDAFASRIQVDRIDQDDYYLYSRSTRGRFLTFGFSYGFGKGEAMSYSGGRRY